MDMAGIKLTAGSNVLILPTFDALPTDKYILKSVEGLEPPAAGVNVSESIFGLGSYRGRRPQNRQVIITLGINPNSVTGETVGKLRSDLYSFMSPSNADSSIILSILGAKTGSTYPVLAIAKCYIDKIESSVFSKDPGVQITLMCDSPYLKGTAQITSTAYVAGSGQIVAPNIGNVATGFISQVTLDTDKLSGFLIASALLSNAFMHLDTPLYSGDKIIYNTISGQKAITLQRGASYFSLLDKLTSDSTWLQIAAGGETFYHATRAFVPQAGFTMNNIKYTPLYWGV